MYLSILHKMGQNLLGDMYLNEVGSTCVYIYILGIKIIVLIVDTPQYSI
jgi:hypothetical protein